VVVAFVIGSCGFPRPADVDPDGGPGATGQPYQLLSIEPAIAATDDTLTVEGTFAASATVHFPGGVAQAATLLGEHRATVVVPAAATAGDLTVTTGDVTVGPLPFRRTSFALGLQPLRASYEQADGGRQSATLATVRSAATTVVVGGWLYVLGGSGGSGPLDSIERAFLNADSTIGSFDPVAETALTTARSGHTSVVVGTTLYVIGGTGSAGPLSSVERAAIHPDGSLGSFALVPSTSLAVARTGQAGVIVGNSLYVIGGAQGDGMKLSSIERAVIQPDGTLGPFAIIPEVALATARSDLACEVIGNWLYVIAGAAANSVRLGDVERAVIQPDGTLGPFTLVAGRQLVTVRSSHRSLVLGDGLYVLGGTGSGGVSQSVERAPITADGSLAPFATVPGVTLSTPRTGLAIATVGTSLYVLGGNDGNGPLRAIERASLNVSSAVGAFATSDISLVVSQNDHTSTVVRNFIYIIGGISTENSVQRARIRPDGSLGAFDAVPEVSLVSSRPGHSTVVIRNFLYVLGGGSGGGGFPSSIERAAMNDDGSLGTFATVSGVTLNEGRSGHMSVVIGDFLYVIGGFGACGRNCGVERAAINANGTLGSFATVPGVALNTGRNLFTGLVTNGYVYVMGGASNAGELTSIERASIGGDGSLGTFSTTSTGALLVPRISPTSTVVGGALYVIGGRNNIATITTMERAMMNADGSVSTFSTVQGIAPAVPREAHTATVIGDSLYLVGGNVDILHSVEHASLR
jgi:hypothetical protein